MTRATWTECAARADPEGVSRVAKAEFLEEDRRQLVVVMLAGMDEHMLERVRIAPQDRRDRRDLHHVRPRADDRYDFEARARHFPRIGRPEPVRRRRSA